MLYTDLTLRNIGYISPDTQKRIKDTKLLIAGCGVGSVFAETAVRLGFKHLILIDPDMIEPHNLNRQNFTAGDINTPKVEALAKRLRAIYPDVKIEAIFDKVTVENASEIVAKADFIFDTIDFLDLPGLVALHDACHHQKKKLMTAINAGFGAVGFYFPEKGKCTIRDLFDLPRTGSVAGISYAERYIAFVKKIERHLDPMVVEQFFQVINLLKEGKPCPASQVAPGVACVAALAGTVAARVAGGLPVAHAPDMLMINMSDITTKALRI
jgi:molybdopterin/thiamine biosynthesis adenylyltransferase